MTEDQTERALLALDRLDSQIAALMMMTKLPDRIHIAALREVLPEVAAELRAAFAEPEIGG